MMLDKRTASMVFDNLYGTRTSKRMGRCMKHRKTQILKLFVFFQPTIGNFPGPLLRIIHTLEHICL